MEELSAQAQPDYLFGLLIGHELAGLARLVEIVGPIVLIGDDERYRRALAAVGRAVVAIASDGTERGLWRVASSAGLVPRSTAC